MGNSNILLPSVPPDMRGPASLDPANGHIDPFIGSNDFPRRFSATNGEGSKDGGLSEEFSACFDHDWYGLFNFSNQADHLHFTSKYKRLEIWHFNFGEQSDSAIQKIYQTTQLELVDQPRTDHRPPF